MQELIEKILLLKVAAKGVKIRIEKHPSSEIGLETFIVLLTREAFLKREPSTDSGVDTEVLIPEVRMKYEILAKTLKNVEMQIIEEIGISPRIHSCFASSPVADFERRQAEYERRANQIRMAEAVKIVDQIDSKWKALIDQPFAGAQPNEAN